MAQRRAGRRPWSHRAPPPLAAADDQLPVEIELRVRRGDERAVEGQVSALGHGVQTVAPGILRVAPAGPLRPLLSTPGVLSAFAVRPLPRGPLDGRAAAQAVIEAASVAMNLRRAKDVRTFRVINELRVVVDWTVLSRLGAAVGRRLGLTPTPSHPDLVLVVRGETDLEVAAMLPVSQDD